MNAHLAAKCGHCCLHKRLFVLGVDGEVVTDLVKAIQCNAGCHLIADEGKKGGNVQGRGEREREGMRVCVRCEGTSANS